MSDGPLCDKCEQPSDGDFLRVCRKCAERAGAKVKELEEENAEKDRLLRVDVDNNVLLVEKLERAEVRVKELVGAEREGPNRHCTDCGRAMVWTSERGESWICPYHVWWRMEVAEDQLRSDAQIRQARVLRGEER